jgi:molybdate transport system substrate-binding protein
MGCGERAEPRRELVVLAAASLGEAFDALAAEFERARPGVEVVRSYAGSQTLAAQVEAGIPADVVATADVGHMQRLLEGDLVEPAVVFATNRLVWIVRPGLRGAPLEPGSDVRTLALGAPEVPVGAYAHLALGRLGALERVSASLVSEELDVKGVVPKVLLGSADAGIVYATDVTPSVAARVRVVELPDVAQIRAAYWAAVIRSSAHPGEARAFVAYLGSPVAADLLERHGFGAPR